MKYVLKNKKEAFPLNGPLYSFGRDSMCQYKIPSLKDGISFQIFEKQGQKSLMKMGKASLKVNGKSVDMTSLQMGDEITIDGNSWYFDVIGEKPASKTPLAAFLQVAQALLAGEPNLWKSLPELACVSLQASHGLLLNHQKEKYSFPNDNIPLSESLIQKCLREKKVLVWNFSQEEDLSKSIEENALTSVMVGPMAEGAYLYLQSQEGNKPFSIDDEKLFSEFLKFVQKLLDNAHQTQNLEQEVNLLRGVKEVDGLIYASQEMQTVVKLATKASKLPMPVLLRGDTGTGKEEFAKLIHEHSPYHHKGFWALNCGAISENLIESELFGHKKGSFTGAVEDKKGVFERTAGGTLFLDEIGELPMRLQVKLLRVLQEKKVTPVGSTEEIKVDFRLLSATHVNLEEAVARASFREDLLYRINVVAITLPPLKNRGQDIILLADHFLKVFKAEFSLPHMSFSEAAKKSLLKHQWNGNVRELKNRIQKAFVLCEDSKIQVADLELLDAKRSTLKEAREAAEKAVVGRALQDAKGNLTLGSEILGIDRKVLRELMAKLSIRKEDFKEATK
jgi:DNA-binding NtrC family response regulator